MTEVPSDEADLDIQVCASSGLELRAAVGAQGWRISQAKYGPLNPGRRDSNRPGANPDGWKSWQRWDVPGHRTIYVAEQKVTAFAEVLSCFKLKLGDIGPADLSQYVDDLEGDGWDEVTAEWQQRNFMAPGQLPASWRQDRLMYLITLPYSGWFIAATTAESMAATAKAIGSRLALLGVSEMDLSLLTSGRRDVTCEIAEWIHGYVLGDGSYAHGIEFPSRHDGSACWAVWLRGLDDGQDLASEPTQSDDGTSIDLHDAALQTVLRRFNLHCH
ncbi:MAG: hypothetical protein JWM61_3309 [Micrococcaceae bacterium]|jgi:hypothetical protein|nr:hypothetical protein [Micrococcaceae bacterium]